MKVAMTGANGQVGQALHKVLSGHTVVPLTRPAYELSEPALTEKISALRPDLVIHSAAMTHVDGCAKDPKLAYLVNGFGTQNVALACQRLNIPMVYISTNEVFDGSASEPYHEYAQTGPINAYGQSKLAGEKIAARLLQKLYIVRISWVFAPGGNNFPAKMIQLADQHGQLRVVTDEISTPTYAPHLAEAIVRLVQTGHFGTYHLSNEGVCSRYEYAVETLRQSGRGHVPVEPISSKAFQRASTPPPYAPLENNLGAALGIRLRPWKEALAAYLREEAGGSA